MLLHSSGVRTRVLFVLGIVAWVALLVGLLWQTGESAVRISEHSFRRLMQGPGLTVAEILKQTPLDYREDKLAALQSQFQFPLKLVLRDEVKLSPEDTVMLQRGVVADIGDDDYAYVTLDDDTLIQFGPMQVSASIDDVLIEPIFWLTTLVGIAPLPWMAYLVIRRRRSQQLALSALSSMVRNMSSGQLTEVPELGLEWRSLVTTIQEQTRQVSALNERHKEVSQAVSHELRTPLSRMRFALALLARCEDAESRERLQERLLHDVNELESLVRASLTFSRLGHAPAALSRERMTLRDWLEDEVAALEVAPESTHLNIRSKHSEIIGDRGLLHLIVRNLLTNAVKYGRSQVGVVVEDKSDDHLLIHIDDDGPGILQGDLERVFEPFVRLNSQQREANGFGLGLAIVQRAAQWHQAEITIGRSPMGGARFTVSVLIQL